MTYHFHFRALWPLWLSAVVFATFTLWVILPIDPVLALISAPFMGIAGWFAMGLVCASADGMFSD